MEILYGLTKLESIFSSVFFVFLLVLESSDVVNSYCIAYLVTSLDFSLLKKQDHLDPRVICGQCESFRKYLSGGERSVPAMSRIYSSSISRNTGRADFDWEPVHTDNYNGSGKKRARKGQTTCLFPQT